jgi:pyruvate dehydrogenase E1 component beta subunit
MFAHIPGLKVVMPSTPYDAKGLMIAAIKDENPVVFIDDRWLHAMEDIVPETMYEVQIGKAAIMKEGKDVTLVASSYMAHLSVSVAEKLVNKGIDVEVIDLRTIKPYDSEAILKSVKKTGRLVVADGGWQSFGVSAEIEAMVFENAFDFMKAPPKRVCLPDCPAPASQELEKAYYPSEQSIEKAIREVL